jgi:hypothetical protein
MPSERADLALEEYRALRATIRERGTTRALVTTITFVSWAGLSLATAALFVLPALGLIPLLVLAAGFEVVFALHVGVERIGRYVQTRYESGADLPGWEHAAMKIGMSGQAAGGGTDPILVWPFALATALNLLVVLILQMDAGPMDAETVGQFEGQTGASFAIYVVLHAVLVVRLIAARRFARSQRERDLQLFS